MKKKQEMKIFALIIGLLTVAAIIVSQLFYFQDSAQAKSKKETKTEQQQNEQQQEETFISVPSPSLPSSPHVLLEQEIFCLFEISSEGNEASINAFSIATPVVQLFQTLVGAVISPNAP